MQTFFLLVACAMTASHGARPSAEHGHLSSEPKELHEECTQKMIGGECGAGMQCWGNGQGKNWCCFPSGAKPNDFLAKGQVQWGAKACCNGEWMDMGMGQHRVIGTCG
mmetsp:Transcript_136999/g.193830  ORF Transcript_136999/g.193830 Transcript_136999/m.193830 type:complete len:108 (-) Transcript_136999:51-374(-)